MKIGAIDLFCGCGGISAGLREAGFEILAGVDINKKYIQTFEKNFKKAKAVTEDITKIPPKEFLKLIGASKKDIKIIAGGPPCQGFSKNVPRKHRYLEDPRNQLIKTFLDYCEEIRPPLVLMENVAEMKNGFDNAYTIEIQDRLSACGYKVNHVVLNAADYGVPQRRKRAFFLAALSDLPTIPEATHSKSDGSDDLFALSQHVSVWDAIGDLPSLEHGDGYEVINYATKPLSDYQKKARRNLKQVTNHVSRKMSDIQHQRLSSLEPGQGIKNLPAKIRPKGGYSGAYGRLTKEMIAPTITRWVFHPGSGRWGHPVDIRTLSIREVARVQGFYDDFEFHGTYVDQAGQLGNAVPAMLAEVVGKHLAKYL